MNASQEQRLHNTLEHPSYESRGQLKIPGYDPWQELHSISFMHPLTFQLVDLDPYPNYTTKKQKLPYSLCRTAFAKSNASENVGTLQIEHQNQVSIAILLA
ncbi:hypothetical protein NC653_019337 [Populus alba x Populus x berolinensis]|uniref:Uncharacterized protein n=1 Tax=Populus alba x Populus x berolinensis TaxID=444605 RepID=A0AAD6QIL2_9ROSI|nr:hypothetical protein NC653_019337 [Populus alba x Populus x berolinensis]